MTNNKQTMDAFYKDIQALDFRFPVKAISEATGYSKGTVSTYLKKNDDPSDNFLKVFYQKFGESLKKVSRDTSTAPETPQNGQKKLPYTRIGELVNQISFVTRLTQDEIADRLPLSRSHLNTLMYHRDSEKAYNALIKEFAKELQSDKLTSTTKTPVFEMNQTNGNGKDQTISQLVSNETKLIDTNKDQQQTIQKLVDLLASKEKDK